MDGLKSGEDGARYYQGLPCTYVALVLPLAFLVGPIAGPAHLSILAACVAGLAVAMTASIRIVKPTGVAYLGFATLALAVCLLLAVFPQLVAAVPGS